MSDENPWDFKPGDKVPPIYGQLYQTVEDMDSYDAHVGRYNTLDIEEAQVITSLVANSPAGQMPNHKLIIDVDLPAKLVPSSTEGHFHLYIDKEMSYEAWATLLYALAAAGIIEPGYMRACIARGFSAVRLPWIKKTQEQSIDDLLKDL